MNDDQFKALRLADAISKNKMTLSLECAAELRRLHAQRDALLEALKTVEWHGQGSCWVVDADKIEAAIAAATKD